MARTHLSNREILQDDAGGVVGGIAVAEYPRRDHSFGEIKRAGAILTGAIPADRASDPEIQQAFRVAHNWRMAHAYPMVIERIRLGRIARSGVVTAGRVKRMASIRAKLGRGSTDLRSMQDLGGCRAVMHDVAAVRSVVDRYRNEETASRMTWSRDYIESPKDDGYRGIHLILTFAAPDGREEYSGQRLEIQVRTLRQHVWATAIEAVGAMRNESLKAGQGDPGWLRLMALMGHYLALRDGLPLVGFDTHAALCREIAEMDRQLAASAYLAAAGDIVRMVSDRGAASHVFRLSVDAVEGRVRVERQTGFTFIGEGDFQEEGEQRQSVIVNVERLTDLPKAFPNFYLDLEDFRRALDDAVRHRSPAPAGHTPGGLDLSFLRGWRRR